MATISPDSSRQANRMGATMNSLRDFSLTSASRVPRRRDSWSQPGTGSGETPGKRSTRVVVTPNFSSTCSSVKSRYAILSPLSKNLPRRVPPRRPDDTPAGMRCRAAQEQSADRRAIAGVADHRAQHEELVERHCPLEDVAAGQVERPLQVERRQHLAGDHRLLEARGVFFED